MEYSVRLPRKARCRYIGGGMVIYDTQESR
jgi:hypothetical protein